MKSFLNSDAPLDKEKAHFIFELYNLAPIGINTFMGPDHVIEFANPLICEIWDRTYEDIINKPLFEALPEVSGQGFETILNTVLQTGEPFRGNEVQVSLKRNSTLSAAYFNLLYQPIKEKETITGILQIAIEVTDQVLARKALEENQNILIESNKKLLDLNNEIVQKEVVLEGLNSSLEVAVREANAEADLQRERLERFFMQAPAAICVLNGPDMVFELINPAYQLLFPGRVLLGKALLEAVPEITGTAIYDIISNVYNTGETFEGKEVLMNLARYEGAPLEQIYFNFTYQARLDKNGAIDGILVFAYEVNELVLAKREIEMNFRRFETLSNTLPQIIWTATPDGMLDYFSKQWYDFSGLTFEESVGDGWARSIHPDDLPDLVTAWRYSLQTGDVYQTEARIKSVDDTYSWILIRALAVKNNEGHIQQWYGTCTIIQHQKEEEQKLQAMSEDLATAYEEIQASNEEIQASNEELLSLNEQLTQINSDMDNFIYTASHDLKAPISNLEGLLDAFSTEYTFRDEEKAFIDMMFDSIERFKVTINDLTEMTHVQKGDHEEINSVNIPEMVSEVKATIDVLINLSKAEISTDFEIEDIQYSKKNLRSILYNLLSNAVKYSSPVRTPKIIISTKVHADYVLLSMQDNGLGMSINNKDSIFGMFKRLHDHVEGTGVGLYLVKRMIENSGGKIEVESELGVGSVFNVYFYR